MNRRSVFSYLLPHPLFSLVIVIIWVVINNSVAPGTLLLGALIAWLVPHYTRNFWPYHCPIRKPWRLLQLLGIVLYDILVANFSAAKLILGPRRALRPGFVTVDLQLTEPVAITLLTSFISLTPGTVSAEVSADHRCISVHCLDVDDPDAIVSHIKRRYEAPLLEIFSC